MAHYAQVIDGIVSKVIVAEQEFIDSLPDKENWLHTSYNTRGGVHILGGTPLRKNFAGIGYAYDAGLDAFIPPRPYPSWTLNEATCLWGAPVPMPEDGRLYVWDESSLVWVDMDPSGTG